MFYSDIVKGRRIPEIFRLFDIFLNNIDVLSKAQMSLEIKHKKF